MSDDGIDNCAREFRSTAGGFLGICVLKSGHDGACRVDPSGRVGEEARWTRRLYGCAKRGCDAVNPDYLSFGTSDGRGYCLHHIPLRSRLRVWWQERRAP